jgi:hypothetical protein
MKEKLMVEIFTAITETRELLESFPPSHVIDMTSTSPSELMAKELLKQFLNKERSDD